MAKAADTKTKETTKKRKTLLGEVVKMSGENTIKVRVESKTAHPLYGKVVASHSNILAHVSTEQFEEFEIGDMVVIGEIRPVSKKKSWAYISKAEVK